MLRSHAPLARHTGAVLFMLLAGLTLPAATIHATDCVDYRLRIPWVGTVDASAAVRSVTIGGDKAYLALGESVIGESGLAIVDLSSPSTPVLIGQYIAGESNDVAVGADHAYLAEQADNLLVLDISDPATPVLDGSVDPGSEPNGVTVSGPVVYLACDGGLVVVDVSDPTTPTVIAGAPTTDIARDLAIDGNHVYVAAASSGLIVFDVTDPANPVQIATEDTPGSATDIVVAGGLAYLADGSGGLQIIDIADPAVPSTIGSLVIDGDARGVAVGGTGAWLAGSFTDHSQSGMLSIDVGDPAAPTLLGAQYVVLAQSVAVAGDDVVTGWELPGGYGGLEVFAIGDATTPVPDGDLITPGRGVELRIDGDVGYLADTWGGLQIVDLSDLATPAILATVTTSGDAADVAIAGDYAFVAEPYWGIEVVDIATPASPFVAGDHFWPGVPDAIVIIGDLAYVADGLGLVIIDISTPTAPSTIGSLGTPGNAVDVKVAGDRAYVLDTQALHIIDVSVPTAPAAMGSMATASAFDLEISGTHAYIADHGRGLLVADISNPVAPFEVTRFHHQQVWARGVAIAGDILYLANLADVIILDISNPASPGVIGNFPVPSARLAIDGEHAFCTIPTLMTIMPAHCQATASVTAAHPSPPLLARFRTAPNPSSTRTVLSFEIGESSAARLEIFDVTGRRVRMLVDEYVGAGPQAVTWDGLDGRGRQVASGIYIARLSWEGGSLHRSLAIVR